MRKILSVFAMLIATGLAFHAIDAEAKRLGGSRSLGMQRQMTPPARPATPPAAAPAPAMQAPTKAAPTAAATQNTGARSWLGPIAGLAAGLGLAALAAHFGFGEELAAVMLMALVAFALLALFGFLMRRRAPASRPAFAGAHGVSYAALEPTLGSGDASTTGGSIARLPAGFDVEGFLRSAKVGFLRLQAANDEGNLADLREFTTPEMFAELKLDLEERRGTAQRTDVLQLEAEVLDVSEEDVRYVASVRFTGQMREEEGGPLVPFDEVWHLVKPRDGSSGWKLAGIQQMQ